ncbi:hypothetical protein RBSWK_04874 [Rhodopirellula baltica SWK14]|uniref:Uncharacterized protein n=1 Tax=Rhodopirellula baltica SWK14 TaxID=993516 RepID=L7CDG4_RHOBT|nr:hypothetical protein RBSWK_04874 [Rhodopirellula baltica SWK14]
MSETKNPPPVAKDPPLHWLKQSIRIIMVVFSRTLREWHGECF